MYGNRNDLLNKNIGPLFLSLAVPAVLIGIVVGLYNIVDAMIVGQFVGPDAVAAVSLSYVLSLFNWAVAFFIGVGSMSLLSRSIGAKNWDVAKRIPGNLVTFNLVCSLFLTAVTFLFSSQLLSLVGGTGNVLVLSERYIRILCLGYVFASNSMGLNFLLRGEGKMKEALTIVFVSNGLNIALDYLMVGPLAMGVEGAAIATVASQAVFFAVMAIYYLSGKSSVGISGVGISRELLAPIGKVGVSAMLLMVLMAFQQATLLRLADGAQNAAMLIVMSAAMRLFTFLPIFAKGVSEGMQPALGVAYGAKDAARMRSIVKGFTVYGTMLILVPYAIVMAFPSQILGLFITDSAIVLQGYGMLRMFFSAYMLYVVIFNISYYYISIGKAKESLVFVLVRQVALFSIAAIVLPHLAGTDGIWYIVPVADVLSLLCGMALVGRDPLLGFLKITCTAGKKDLQDSGIPLQAARTFEVYEYNNVQH